MSKPPAPIVIDKPGFYSVEADVYHRDPVVQPSLSHSIMHEMLRRSPRHARWLHPRLNPRVKPRQATAAMQEGTILHWLILDAGAEPYIIDAADFRSEAAKAYVRKAAEERRPITTLTRYHELRRVAAAARTQLRGMLDVPSDIAQGHAECTMVWREGREWCRSMADWLVPRPKAPIVDFKFTGRAAAAEEWAKTAADNGYDIQRSFLRRGFEQTFQMEAGEVYFVTVETDPPYGVSVNALGFEFAELGDEKVKRGIQLWQVCRAAGEWPGYTRRAHYVDLPRFAAMQWEARDMRQLAAVEEALRSRHRNNPDVRRLIEEHGFV